MSIEIRNKLDKAKDEVEGLQTAYYTLIGGSLMNRTRRSNFVDFMTATIEFVADKIDDVYCAMDNAVDEIERLDDKNYELAEKIKELESRVEELEEDK